MKTDHKSIKLSIAYLDWQQQFRVWKRFSLSLGEP